ncbi:MAG: hypothetical protein [Circoviridae sp.]|nr:MAG: hypothetical protein [Circoviridae sp.]
MHARATDLCISRYPCRCSRAVSSPRSSCQMAYATPVGNFVARASLSSMSKWVKHQNLVSQPMAFVTAARDNKPPRGSLNLGSSKPVPIAV